MYGENAQATTLQLRILKWASMEERRGQVLNEALIPDSPLEMAHRQAFSVGELYMRALLSQCILFLLVFV